jgi:hypothetical protein
MEKAKVFACAALLALGVIAGCAGTQDPVTLPSASNNQNVFQEVDTTAPPSQGYLDLYLSFSVKTHKRGAFAKTDKHGTADYSLAVTIEGQKLLLHGLVQQENSEPQGMVDPEAGDGIRYRFSTKLRLKAGTHRIVVALPADGIVVTRELTLEEGRVNTLLLEPIYGSVSGMRSPRDFNSTSFRQGVKGIRLTLNGSPV